ncbi:MAG TPA: TonB-dependent receptor [Candidatus Aminicenantes bacterium]|nr:TonB-dependent receptor [Candidatus Aminicenantes bacterium]
MRNAWVSLVLFCLWLSLPAPAAEEKKEKPDIEERVEVIGKVPLARALQSVSVLDREQVQACGRDGLQGLMNLCPGILVLNAGNPAQFSYAFARGAAVNQLLYLVDGVKLHDPSSSLAGNFSFLDPQLIEKVEVVRGPLSSLYGSSAMGGVVNVVTRRDDGLGVSFAGGSHGTLAGNLHFGRRLGDFRVSVNGSLLDYDERLANDRVERRSLSIHSGFQRDGLSLGLSLFGQFVDAGIPWNLGAPTPRRGYAQDNFIVALPLSLALGRSGRLEVTGSLHWNRYDFHDPDDSWNPQFANDSFTAEAQARYSATLMERLNLVVGADVSSQRIANSENGQPLIARAAMALGSVYADLQADLGRLLLSGSLRVDRYQGLAAVFSPHLGALINIAPFLKLRASASRSFRAPSLPEMLNPYWGNSGLKPETGGSLEAGFDCYLPRLQGGITVFASTYRNLIGFSPLTNRFANIHRADVSGAEASCDWEFAAGLRARVAYTFLHTRDAQYGRELLRRPRHVLNSSLSYNGRRLSLAVEAAVVGSRLDYDELLWTVAENKSFSQVGLLLRQRLLKNMEIFCRVDNALNFRFEEVLGYPAPRRRVMVGAAYRVGE